MGGRDRPRSPQCPIPPRGVVGGLDAVAFTGGVGEQQPDLRARVAEGLSFLGVVIDDAANAAALGDTDITALGAACRAVVVTAREDLQIARLVRATIARRQHHTPSPG